MPPMVWMVWASSGAGRPSAPERGCSAACAGVALAGDAAAAGALPGSGMLGTPCTAIFWLLLPAGQGLFCTVSAPVASVQR
jgi:hypothetical protein